MQVHRQLDQLPAFTNAILTIGTFDGVHGGHQQIIQQLKAEAALAGGETVVITFHPHPRKVLRGDDAVVQLLTTTDEKIALLRQSGIDHLVIVPFTPAFALLSARDYIARFLVEKFHPHTIILGYDHQFGHNREGNYHLLEALKEVYGFKVKEIPAQVLHQVAISSTKIRNAILSGEIEEANAFLGYPYFFEGLVVPGNKLGRTLGFPTANLQPTNSEKLVPAHGVYAVRVFEEGKWNQPQYQGMMNIGIRPTIGGIKRMIEVNIFDFDADIYGQTIGIQVLHRLRGEQKFDGLDALKGQLAKDKEAAIAALG